MNDIGELKSEYQAIPIPQELESMVRSTIGRQRGKMRRNAILRTSMVSLTAVFLIFAAVVNLSPASASAMERVPLLKGLVRLVMFTEMSYDSGSRRAEVQVPEIKGLDGDLAKSLNQEYLQRSTELYTKFVEGYGEDEWSPLFLETNFNVKASTDEIFVVESIVTEIGASARESVRYDNIDLKNQIIITLPSLFRDESYVGVISDNIKTQMRENTDLDEGIVYFIKGEAPVDDGFDKIDPEQIFYINSDSKLVIVFNEYDVAPGSMGIVEFVIPAEVIQDLLVSNVYVK